MTFQKSKQTAFFFFLIKTTFFHFENFSQSAIFKNIKKIENRRVAKLLYHQKPVKKSDNIIRE